MTRCDYAGCGRTAIFIEDDWVFCRDHLRAHRDLLHETQPSLPRRRYHPQRVANAR